MKLKLGMLMTMCLVLAAGLLPARAADLYYVSGPGEQFHGYTAPVLAIRPGDKVTYVNTDIASHDVVAGVFGPDVPLCATYGYLPGRCPLFWTPLIGLGQQTAVNRIDAVAPGTYPFKCTLHGAMQGTLVVLPA